MEIKQVAVLGATGSQGGAVAAALAKKGISVVALTRNPDSASAKALAERPNTTVRKADLDDVDSLAAAFEGCDGAFVIANFWDTMSAEKEMVQYKNATDALKKVGTMKHVVFSTLDECTKDKDITGFKVLEEHESGPMVVPHFDGKARAETLYFEGLPTTFMLTSCYFENFTTFFGFNKQEDGSYTFTLPLQDKKVPWTMLPDVGKLAASIFGKEELIGKHVGQASIVASGDEIAEIYSKATGKTIKYNPVPWETFASFGFPGADELAQMFEAWFRQYGDFVAARDPDTQLKIMGESFTDAVEYAKTLPVKFDG